MRDRAEYYRFLVPLFKTTEDDHSITLICRACGHELWYFANADPKEIQTDADDHTRIYHPELDPEIHGRRLYTPSEPS